MKFIRFDVGIVRKLFLISSIVLLASCGGGGGGGDGDGAGANRFPTPALPAAAVKIDPANADTIANSVLDFTGILFGFVLKTEGPPSISQVIKIVTGQVNKRNRIYKQIIRC